MPLAPGQSTERGGQSPVWPGQRQGSKRGGRGRKGRLRKLPGPRWPAGAWEPGEVFGGGVGSDSLPDRPHSCQCRGRSGRFWGHQAGEVRVQGPATPTHSSERQAGQDQVHEAVVAAEAPAAGPRQHLLHHLGTSSKEPSGWATPTPSQGLCPAREGPRKGPRPLCAPKGLGPVEGIVPQPAPNSPSLCSGGKVLGTRSGPWGGGAQRFPGDMPSAGEVPREGCGAWVSRVQSERAPRRAGQVGG